MIKHKCAVTMGLNLVTFILVIEGILTMFFGSKYTSFTASDASCLIYFTILSNIFAGLTSFVYCMFQILYYKKGINLCKIPFVFQFVSTISVTITFLVVVFFLAPFNALQENGSYFSMFQGSNLIFHFFAPVICIINFIFLEHEEKLNFKFVPLTLLPVVLYGIFYLTNYHFKWIKSSTSDGKGTYDWYNFLQNGSTFNMIVLVILFVLITIGLGFLFIFLNNKTNKQNENPPIS